jgi:hypothetical protein
MHSIIKELTKENLSTYFILPLLGLNKEKFGESNFLNCYLSKDLEYCYVKVLEPLMSYVDSVDTIIRSNCTYYKLKIGPEHKEDVLRYASGKYSQFSHTAKQKICTNSGLIYKILTGDDPNSILTDIRLLALKKDTTVKSFWKENIYGVDSDNIISDDLELLSKPTEKDFIEYELSV